MSREIKDVLTFRRDLSPFLTHLTKRTGNKPAFDNLKAIITSKQLIQSGKELSDIKFQYPGTSEEKTRLTAAICFTETPLDQIHCLLEIEKRSVNLTQFGLVFLRSKLQLKNASPCVYLNNWRSEHDSVIRSLGTWGTANPDEAKKILPLISCFGSFFPARSGTRKAGEQDFYWEREWRIPFCYGPLDIVPDDLFCGLCPEERIKEAEDHYQSVFHQELPFIDPLRPATFYAKKLVQRRNALALTDSVV